MKATIISLLVFIFLFSNTSNAQCLENGDFAEFCGVQPSGCPYFSYPCVPNWKRSHGTPQIMVPDANPIDNLAYMWFANSNGLRGEGIFASFTFRKNTSYIITIRLNATTAASGQTFLYAANNMTEGAITSTCGDPLPTVSSKELIGQINEYNLGWKIYTISFTPTSDYSQLWLYPYTTSASQFNLYVDYVFACPDTCTGTVIYNNGQVPVGDTKAGYIYAGSSAGTGGSGIVTVVPDQTTTFIAANEIDLLPDFTATVTSGQFIAKIMGSCDSVILERNNPQDIDVSQFPKDPLDSVEGGSVMVQNGNILNESSMNFKIYPNPSNGTIFIQPGVRTGEKISIEVLDVNGHILQKKENIYDGRQVLLNASSYKSGYYFVKVKSKNFVRVGRVFIE
ncbi:MAG TPA: T9SS type A sorting domain-containing protein [Chitinophagaceae bacterium]|jgi:hypothetical protein|nr:T9SS type A sorting domain-containing protein [Chitinophagaceae bacterium]